MMTMMLKKPSYSWWFDSHISPRRSPWLQSTLSELDEKTKAMLKLIEEDADSFAQRAEMYYKKRPELVNMVEDFYRAHRSLAEKYDQLKSEAGTRFSVTQLGSPLFNKNPSVNSQYASRKSSVASSDYFDSEESEVDDPEEEVVSVAGEGGEEVSSKESEQSPVDEGRQLANTQNFHLMEEIEKLKEENTAQKKKILRRNEEALRQPSMREAPMTKGTEMLKLMDEIERLKQQNRRQETELREKDEEKRETIRQLCLSIDVLKEENSSLRKCLKECKKKSPVEHSIWKHIFSGKFFDLKCRPSVLAL